MNYPSNIKKEYKKVISHSNRGMALEDLINQSNDFYLQEDIAVIYKKPTPITIVDASFDSHGRVITKAYFKEPSTLDYNGIYRGKYVDFDAKVTKSKTSFPLSNLHEHQYQHMINVLNHGGITFLIISINNKFYYLDGQDIIDFKNNYSRQSIPLDYIEEKGIEIETKIKPRLDFIKAIDKKHF